MTFVFLGDDRDTGTDPVTLAWASAAASLDPDSTVPLTLTCTPAPTEDLVVSLTALLPPGATLTADSITILANATQGTVTVLGSAELFAGTGTVAIDEAEGIVVGDPSTVTVTTSGASTGNSPTEGITTNGKLGSTVHAYFDNTLEENKALFLPGMRANRAPRPNEQISVTDQHTNARSWSDTSFLTKGYANWAFNTGKSPNVPATARPDGKLHVLDNCLFANFDAEAPRADGTVEGTNWANQTYDQPGQLTRNTDFESVATGPVGYYDPSYTPPPFTAAQEAPRYPYRFEHDQYMHTANSCIWQGVTSFFTGGHQFYIANRFGSYAQYPPDNVAADRPELAMLDNCHLIDGNISTAKGSNKVEIFDFGNPLHQSYLVVRNSTLIDAYPFYVNTVAGNGVHEDLATTPESGWARAKGLVNVSGYQYCERGGNESNATGIAAGYDAYNSPQGFGAGPCFMKLALIKNCLLQTIDPSKNFCSFGGVQDVVFEDCTMTCDGNTRPIALNSEGYLASDPGTSRGLPRVQTITLRNCLMRGITLVFKRTGGLDIYVTPPQDLRGREIRYDCLTGAVVFDRAYDSSTDYTDVAEIVNTVDPFAGLNSIPADFDWNMEGVLV